MKKVFLILSIIGIIGLSSTFFIIHSFNKDHIDVKKHDSTSSDNKDNVDNTEDNTEVIIDETTKQEDEVKKDNTESINKEQTESPIKTNSSNNKTEDKKTTTNNSSNKTDNKTNNSSNSSNNVSNNTSSNNSNSTSNNDSNKQENEASKNDTPVNNTPKPKGVCNSSNSGWVSYLSKWKQNNPTAVVFDTKTDAINYGKYAMSDFGYAYEYSTIPVAYEDEECKKEIWSTRLSVPQKTCIDTNGNYNNQIWLKATSKERLIDIYDYLRGQGYDCGTKKWYK